MKGARANAGLQNLPTRARLTFSVRKVLSLLRILRRRYLCRYVVALNRGLGWKTEWQMLERVSLTGSNIRATIIEYQ